MLLLIGMLAMALMFTGCGNSEDPLDSDSDSFNSGGSSELTGTVSISGTAQVGRPLTAVTNALSGSGIISYQWKRGGDTNIGTNSNTYVVQAADEGFNITVTITRSRSPGSITSAAVTVAQLNSFVEMVWVQGGSFWMGFDPGGSSVIPVHRVTVSGFFMGRTEVTQAQYHAVMGTYPSYFDGESGKEPVTGEVQGKRPVEQVSWYDAIVFCNRMSVMDELTPAYSIGGSTDPDAWIAANGGSIPAVSNAAWNAAIIVDGSSGYRLPTEAQWEYAAKGGQESSGFVYSGSDDVEAVAWFSGNSGDKTHGVGIKSPNELGLYDMSGNVREWCWDWHDVYPNEAQNNPLGATSGTYRVIRGGSIDSLAEFVRPTFRDNAEPYSRSANDIGFRLVRH